MTSSPYLSHAVIDNAVSLVTSAHEGRRNVMTASFFAESSHVPVLLRIAVSRSSLTHELIDGSGWFGLSVLARGQESLALGCGTLSGREGSKFERFGLRAYPGQQGVPLLPACLTTSECQVVERVGLGDHTLFVGKIVRSFRQSALADREALLISDLVDYLRN